MESNNCIKVLNVNYDSDPYGGVTVFLMNVFRHINHGRIKIDFLTADKSSYYPYEQEIKKKDGELYAFHINIQSPFGKLKFGIKLYDFLKEFQYDIVHINCGAVSIDCISAIAAKARGAKVIVHSHNAGGRSLWKAPIIYLMKLIMQKQADILCACSKEAAMNTFTAQKVSNGDVIIIKNGIDIKRFQYNEEMRIKVRKELNLEDHFVIGHIGRFAEQKNHIFLVDIFEKILQKNPTAVLLLIGQGELEPEIREKVQSMHIKKNVIFLGSQNNIEDFYQAMDVLLFPSLFEGLPLTLIEAQATGLQCCISDKISTEVDVTPLIHRVSLYAPVEEWGETVLAMNKTCNQRHSYDYEIKNAGYEINTTATSITKIYEDLMKSLDVN